MSDERTDSLIATLKRRRAWDEYLAWFFSSRSKPPERLEWMRKAGIRTSISSIYRMHRSLKFRTLIASMDAEQYGETLPADTDERARGHLKQARYERSLGDLSFEEEQALAEYYLEQDKLEEKRRDRDLKRETLDHEREKWRAALKGKIEAGLDALAEEIGGNERAMRLYEQLREALSKA